MRCDPLRLREIYGESLAWVRFSTLPDLSGHVSCRPAQPFDLWTGCDRLATHVELHPPLRCTCVIEGARRPQMGSGAKLLVSFAFDDLVDRMLHLDFRLARAELTSQDARGTI